MEIRRLGPGDGALVAQVTPLFDRPPHAAAVRAFLADPQSYLLVAYVDDQPAGFIRAHALRQLDTPRPQVLLYEIGVAPAFRRRGVARGLIGQLKGLCQACDADEIFVITDAANHPAMEVYGSTDGRREAPDAAVFVYPFS
jgi:ribosomal protein S18 acetylase RimI-like enzyme